MSEHRESEHPDIIGPLNIAERIRRVRAAVAEPASACSAPTDFEKFGESPFFDKTQWNNWDQFSQRR